MKNVNIKKLLILNIPYILLGLFATNLGEAWRLAEGADMSAKLLGFFDTFISMLPKMFRSVVRWTSRNTVPLKMP